MYAALFCMGMETPRLMTTKWFPDFFRCFESMGQDESDFSTMFKIKILV